MSWKLCFVVAALIGSVLLYIQDHRKPDYTSPGPNDFADRIQRAYQECAGYGGNAFTVCVTRKLYPHMYNTRDL